MQKNEKIFNKINKFIKKKINKLLNYHNGYIKLINIDKKNNIFFKFYGHCKSCLIKKNTYENIINKKIKEKFKKINKIIMLN